MNQASDNLSAALVKPLQKTKKNPTLKISEVHVSTCNSSEAGHKSRLSFQWPVGTGRASVHKTPAWLSTTGATGL